MQSLAYDTDSIDSQVMRSAEVTNISDTPSDSKSSNNDISLKTWNSLPVLDKNLSKSSAENSIAGSSTIHDSSSSNNSDQFRAIKLAEIINVNYSESKQPVDIDNGKSTIKVSVRKTRNRVKIRKSQKRRGTDNLDAFSNVYEKEHRNNVEEHRECTMKKTHATMLESTTSIKSIEQPRKKTSFLTGSAPEFSWILEVEGQKDIRTTRKSFMEDGGSSVQPMATGYFPRPVEGQSLTSFLSSAQFSRAHDAELDRENAHFSICEAMIAAIEQIKCNRVQRRLLDDAADDESDEEINRLKQRIRLRRRQRQEEKSRGKSWSHDLLSDGRTDTTTTTDQSVSPLSTSSGNSSDSMSTYDTRDSEELDELEPKLRTGGGITDSTMSESSVSAEGVALSLISRFSEKQLPRASELQWLVSEKDAPQRLLPMPKSWPVSSDEVEDARTIPLRGTVDWAPPRPQIIFTPHAPPV